MDKPNKKFMPFTSFENEIVMHLFSCFKTKKSISLKEFLELVFFTKESGRSLIIQSQDKYARFFIPYSSFLTHKKQLTEIESYVELFSFLDYLSKQGYIYFYKEAHHQSKKVCFIGTEFENPIIQDAKLILNSKNDYSDNPQEIKNVNGEIIRKSIEFVNNDFIIQNCHANLFISKKILKLKEKNKKKIIDSKRTVLILNVLAFILIKLIIIMLIFIKKDINTSTNYGTDHKFKASELKIKKSRKDLLISQNKFDSTRITSSNSKRVALKYGVDISRWNDDFFEHPLPDSLSFIICKATEGVKWIDTKFKSNIEKTKHLGLAKGVYHFYRIGDDPKQQAEYFWSQIRYIEKIEIPPVLDIERGSLKHQKSINPELFERDVLTFLLHFEKISSLKPMLYSSVRFANKYLTSSKFSEYPLWIAHYTLNEKPDLPTVWKETGYTIWQKTDSYNLNTSNTDFDIHI